MEALQDVLADWYLVIKAAHIVSVISWMAGMLYLPRLFVYHCYAKIGSEQSETFKVMEHKLLKIIINPAMILTFVLGGMLLFVPGMMERPFGWIHAKLFLVLILAGFHGFMAKTVKIFAADKNTKSPKFYRVFNEGPAVIMIIVVFLVVLKPF